MTRRHLWFAFQLAGTLLLLFVLFRGFDWRSFAGVLGRLSPVFYAGSLAAVIGGQLLYVLRWQVVLAGMGIAVPYAEVLQQYLVGMFFSNLMPSAVGGDAAKVFYLGRRAGYVEVGASVFIDRFLGFFWLATIGAVTAWLVPAPTALFVLNRRLLTLFAMGFSTVLGLATFAPVDRMLSSIPQGGRARAWIDPFLKFVNVARAGGTRPRTLVVSGAVVFSYVALMTVVYLWYFAAVGAIPPPAFQVMNVIVSMSIFINVPISVNGIGLREQLHYLLLAALGLPKEVAVSISLLVFAHFLLLGLLGYAVWLRSRAAMAGPVA